MMKAPRKGSRQYKAVITAGCGGSWQNTPNGEEFDCPHEYDWTCDVCPINTQFDKPNPVVLNDGNVEKDASDAQH